MRYLVEHSRAGLVDRYFDHLEAHDRRAADADVEVVDRDRGLIEAPEDFVLRGFGPLQAVPFDDSGPSGQIR